MALAVLALAPLPLLAQGGGARGGAMMGARLLLEQGSVEFLASKGTELALDDAQAGTLKEIGGRWATATKEAREKIRAELPQRGEGGDREAMRARVQALQPQFQKLVEEDEKALAEAMQLLNATQQERARALLEERRANARPRRAGGNG